MRSAGGGRRRDSDNGKVNGRGAGRGRGTVRMYNLQSTVSEELEEKKDKTLSKTRGGKSVIRTYVHNGTPIQRTVVRTSPCDKKKQKNLKFNTKNNAGDNENNDDITTKGDKDNQKTEDNNRRNETKEGSESPIDTRSTSWQTPMKTVKKRESRVKTMTRQRDTPNTNKFDILMDTETNRQEYESDNEKKRGKMRLAPNDQ